MSKHVQSKGKQQESKGYDPGTMQGRIHKINIKTAK